MGKGRRLGALALAAVLASGAAACGGDDSDEDASGSASASGVEEEAGVEEAADGADDVDTDEIDLEDIDVDDLEDLDDIPGLSEECEVFFEASVVLIAALSGDEGAELGDVAATMEAFVDDAPDDLRADVAVLAAAYAEFAEVYGDLDLSDPASFTDPEVQEAMAEASAIFESPEIAEAQANVDAYSEEHCG